MESEPKKKKLKVDEDELKNEDGLKINEEKEEQKKKEIGEQKEEKEEQQETEEKEEQQETEEKQKEEKEEFTQFVKLFDTVLQENRGKLSDEDLEEGVIDPIKYFQKGISNACAKEKLNEPKQFCGFFHRFAPLYAGKTRRSIAAALLECEELRSCFRRSSLKITDVGSGAGSALVGLYSAIYDGDFPFQYLEVTAMDYNEHWKEFFDSINNKLLDKGCTFGNASKLFKDKNVKPRFVCFDMLNIDGCERKKKLETVEKSDIILMKGFVSILRYDSDREKIMKNVASAMKPGSLLLYIDSSSYAQYFEKKEYKLRLIYKTEKVDSSSIKSENSDVPSTVSQPSPDSNLTAEDAISQSPKSERKKPKLVIQKKTDVKNRFRFPTSEVKIYGPGFSPYSNQEIYILVKYE